MNDRTFIPIEIIHNKNLSLDARGLICMMLALQVNGIVRMDELCACVGYKPKRSFFNELQRQGYINKGDELITIDARFIIFQN